MKVGSQSSGRNIPLCWLRIYKATIFINPAEIIYAKINYVCF